MGATIIQSMSNHVSSVYAERYRGFTLNPAGMRVAQHQADPTSSVILCIMVLELLSIQTYQWAVTRWKPLIALLLLLSWTTCALHCHAEMLSTSEAASCCDEHGGKSNPWPTQQSGHCICSVLFSESFAPRTHAEVLPQPNVTMIVPVVLAPTGDSLPVEHVQMNRGAPALLRAWQFLCRVVASPRAPAVAI